MTLLLRTTFKKETLRGDFVDFCFSLIPVFRQASMMVFIQRWSVSVMVHESTSTKSS